MLRTVLAAFLLLGSCTAAFAVLIDTSGTITFQTTEPTETDVAGWTTGWGSGNITGWNYVGQINNANSAVYLGNNWVITAGHVGAGTFNLDGVDYQLVADSATSITDSTGKADLTMFQIATAPILPSLSIGSPTVGGTVVMIGYGGGQGETWGANTVSEIGVPTQVNGYSFETIDFKTDYSATNLAQLTGGDSGGGDFILDSLTGTWQLAGFNEAIDPDTGDSYFVELDNYSSQIENIENSGGIAAVPEPRQWLLLLLGLLAIYPWKRASQRSLVSSKNKIVAASIRPESWAWPACLNSARIN